MTAYYAELRLLASRGMTKEELELKRFTSRELGGKPECLAGGLEEQAEMKNLPDDLAGTRRRNGFRSPARAEA